VLHWWFHFWNKLPIIRLFTIWKCTDVFDFRPWRWSALNMGFVVKLPSRMQGQCFFWSWAGQAIVFRRVQKISLEGCPSLDLTPPVVHRGGLNVCHCIVSLRFARSSCGWKCWEPFITRGQFFLGSDFTWGHVVVYTIYDI
jgi:hypothetical protein